MTPVRVSAVVLAGGYASRMGRLKPLLPMGEESVIQRITGMFRAGGVSNVVVVTGHRGDEIAAHLAGSGIRTVRNPDYDKGMFSSVQTGVAHLNRGETDAFFLTPADICLIRPSTIRLLSDAWARHPGRIIHPCFDGREGHPPLIPADLIPMILESRPAHGLRTILKGQAERAVQVSVPDRYIHMDMNHPDDYTAACARCERHDIPTEAECEVLLTRVCNTPAACADHCRMVARVTREICDKLERCGTAPDTDLACAAALLHDIAKGEPDHAMAGARMLAEMGFHRVAEIVGRHTDITSDPDTSLAEAEIVYLADKLVCRDRRTTLSHRFETALERFGDNPEARAAVLRRKDAAETIAGKLARLGVTL